MDIEILFEDDNILVCKKPAGVPTETKTIGLKDMPSLLKEYLSQNQQSPEIFIVHRLDQMVGGIMVFAKTKKAAAGLSTQMQHSDFSKKYYAIVENDSLPESGELVDYLIKDQKTNTSSVTSKANKNAKEARLAYKVIKAKEGKSLLDITLYTGRHHQIRVQLSNQKAPIYGDVKYGGTKTGDPLCLYSYSLSFIHPITNKEMKFEFTPDLVKEF